MDDIDHELISLLSTKIGMPMEDHSTLALTVGSRSDGEQIAAVDELAIVSTKIEKLAAAVQSIAE